MELVARHQYLRRQEMATKIRLYEKLIGKLGRKEAAMTPQKRALLDMQDKARTRMDRSVTKVDMKLFSTPMYGESKYAREYAKNIAAIERLVQAINLHPMNDQSALNGGPKSKNPGHMRSPSIALIQPKRRASIRPLMEISFANAGNRLACCAR